MRGPHTLSYIEASAGCRSEGDKHSKDLRLLLDRWGRQIMLQHRQLSRQATEAKDSRCARRARLGCVHRCVRKRRRSIHAFYVRSRCRDMEAQTGLRTAVGEMKTEKAREKEPKAEHDTRRHRVGMLHCCPSTLHSTNLSISPTGQRTEGNQQQRVPSLPTIFVTDGTDERPVHTAN
jgi:hypothetical protein